MDIVDIAQARMEAEEAAKPPRKRYNLPVGQPGECDMCMAEAPRLIDGICPVCRDKWRIG